MPTTEKWLCRLAGLGAVCSLAVMLGVAGPAVAGPID
jgi:hypothetical protein